MACSTILVGKDASYDGSTIIARNEDSANGEFCPKRFIVVKPDEQPRHYKSVLSHVEVALPGAPLSLSVSGSWRRDACQRGTENDGIFRAKRRRAKPPDLLTDRAFL